MNITIRKFLSLFIVVSMLVSLQPAYAADEYFEKMLGYESDEEVSLYSSVEAFESDGEVLIDKKDGFTSADFYRSTLLTEVGSVGGKASDDICARLSAKSQDTYFDTGKRYQQRGMQFLGLPGREKDRSGT